jgi:hypothetical protein
MNITHTIRLKSVLIALLTACTLTPVSSGQSNPPAPAPAASKPPQSDAQNAFNTLKTMAGSWQGKLMGMTIGATIRAASSGTAIIHEMTADGNRPPQQEVTMFYVEQDRLFALHYCDSGDRVRMEGKMSSDGTAIEFNMLDVAGSSRGGLLKRLAFNLTDTAHHGVEGTFVMPDGKAVELRGEFQRK